jgi:hypothetical protein
MLVWRRVDTIDRSCHRRRIKHQYFGAPDRCKQTQGLRLSAEVNAGCRRVNVRHDNPHEMAAAGVRNLNSLVGADHPGDHVILQLTPSSRCSIMDGHANVEYFQSRHEISLTRP